VNIIYVTNDRHTDGRDTVTETRPLVRSGENDEH